METEYNTARQKIKLFILIKGEKKNFLEIKMKKDKKKYNKHLKIKNEVVYYNS